MSFLLGLTVAVQAQQSSETESLIIESYRDYIKASQDYIMTQREAATHIREWRKKRLAEIFDQRLEEIESNLLLSNSSLIDEFQKFLRENGVESLDDMLLIRLSQLYFEKANLEFNQQMKKSQERGGLGDVPVPNYKRAILFSKLFIAKFPGSPIGDKAYYLLGFAHEEMGNPAESLAYYEGLLKNYPASPYAEEVAWRLGEIYYSKGNFAKAEEMYQRLSKIKGSFYTKALYKLGATHFAKRDLNKAIETFEKLISDINKDKNASLEDRALVEEGLDYLATILSHNIKAPISKDYQAEAWYRLGLLYKKRLDEKSMRIVFVNAAKKFPSSSRLPLMYTELIESYEAIQDSEAANRVRSQLIQVLTQNQEWWNKNESYKNIVFQTQDLLEYNLIKSAEYHADKGYLNKDTNQLQIAKNRYYNFITKYSWSPYKNYAKLELADLEYFLGNYTQASNYYFEIVNEADSPMLREEAAYSLVWSEVKKVGYNLNFDTIAVVPRGGEKSAFTPEEKVFSQAALFYISKIKNSPRKNKIIFKLAELYAERGELETSAQYLNMIISDTDTNNLIAVRAYRFLMEIYNSRNDWASLVSVQELYNSAYYVGDVESLDRENLKQKYRDKLESVYNHELEGKYLDAALEIEKVMIQNPRSPMNDFLILKAAHLYLRANQYDRANGAITRLESSKYKAEAKFLKALALYKTARLDEAAHHLEEFARQYRKHSWFEESVLNVISIRTQMNAEEKVVGFIKSLNPLSLPAYIYYSYVQSLLSLKKFDEVYKAVAATKGKPQYDTYKMQYFALKAQHDRFDYVGLEKTCASIEKALQVRTTQIALGTLNKSFCEYTKLKTLVGKSDVSLEQIVNRLNVIYSYKIDFITTLALNEIISKSDLKNTFRAQFEQLIQKGWSIARLYPLSSETQQLSQSVLSYTNKLPLTISYMMNWRAGAGELFDFVNFADKSDSWKDVRSYCESRQYNECLSGLKSIYSTNKGEKKYEILENLIVVSLKLNNDEELETWVTEYIKDSNANERSQIFAHFVGMQDRIPEDKRGILLLQNDPLSVSAKAVEYWIGREHKRAIDTLLQVLKEYPNSAYPYFVLSQIYFDLGQPLVARTIAANGFDNTESKALLALSYQLNALTFSMTSTKNIEFKRDQSLAETFAIGLASLKNKDLETLDKVYKVTKSYKSWFDMVKALELVYTGSNKFKSDSKSSSRYTQWLNELYKLSRGSEIFSLERINSIAQKYHVLPNYREIERMNSRRDIAGDKR